MLVILRKKNLLFLFFFIGQAAPHSLQNLSSPTRDLQWKCGVLPLDQQGGSQNFSVLCREPDRPVTPPVRTLSTDQGGESTGVITCVCLRYETVTWLQTPKTEALGPSDPVWGTASISPGEAWKGGPGGQRMRFGFYLDGNGSPWSLESGFAFYRCDGGQA